jgi:hypothetical protein
MWIVNVHMTVTSLLLDVEPLNWYPYKRKMLDCFDTTNELIADQTNNQICLNIKPKSSESCKVFSGGVYYDLMFDNSPSWRTQ